MTALVSLANDKCGPLTEGRKYCLKIPGVLGGEYGVENLATSPQVELVRISGDIALQIKCAGHGAGHGVMRDMACGTCGTWGQVLLFPSTIKGIGVEWHLLKGRVCVSV